MRTFVLAVSLTAACAGTDKPGSSGQSPASVASGSADPAPTMTPDAAAVAPAPGMLLAQVPTTSSYRVIACTLGPDKRRACEGMLERLVGTQVTSDGTAANVVKTRALETTSDGHRSVVELDKPSGVVVGSSATLLRNAATLTDAETGALHRRARTISPRARWATGERFESIALAGDLDGDRNPDRIVLGTLVDFKQDSERVIVVVAVGLAGKPLEIVAWNADRGALLGTVDLNGDGRDEVLLDRTHGGSATSYRFELMHVMPGKPLATNLRKSASSDGWQPYDVLEDHERD